MILRTLSHLFLCSAMIIMPAAAGFSKPGDALLDIAPTSINDNDEEGEYEAKDPDPLEGLNRVVFYFNTVVNGIFIHPMVDIFKTITPQPVRNGIHNVLENLWAPISFVNYVLQGRVDLAGTTITRFLANTTMGIGGLFDAATEIGISGENTGFGETLAVWGVEKGPYLVLPIIGPSTFREAVGLGMDYITDPLYHYSHPRKNHVRHKRRWIGYTRWGTTLLSQTEKNFDIIKSLEKNAIDYYQSLQSIYLQKIDYRLEKRKQEDHRKSQDKRNDNDKK